MISSGKAISGKVIGGGFWARLARRMLVVLVMAMVALAGPLWEAGPCHALSPDEQLKDAALEARARELSAELRCLVCQNQSIDDSDAPLAKDLRHLVRERLVAGDSNTEVMNFLVQRYGDFVLLKPPFGWHTWLLWLAPALLLIATCGRCGRNLAPRQHRDHSFRRKRKNGLLRCSKPHPMR